MLWIAIGVLTAGVLWVLAWPWRAARPAPQAGEGELEVYRDQLKEIEADRRRGTIEVGEAQAARVEVSRRLLAEAAHGSNAPAASGRPEANTRRLVWGAGVCVAALALSLYAALGTWRLPGQPHAALKELIVRVEERLREHPDDGQGWDVIAPVYLKIGRYGEAAQAYARAIRLLGESGKRLQGFAQALRSFAEAALVTSNGIVTEEARRAFEMLAKLDPAHPEPHFWLALAKEQDGQLEAAAAAYGALLAAAPADVPWRKQVENRLALVKSRLAAAGATPESGPAPEDMAAAQNLSAEERNRMIEGMVERLAERLKANGKDVEGWRRLLRSYTVLGQRAKAAEALARARTALAGDNAALSELEEFAKALGLGS